MRRTTRTITAIVSAAGLGLAVASTAPAGDQHRSHGVTAVGLSSTGTALTKFSVERPGRIERLGSVQGLAGDTRLVGIDYRVQDGLLYGVGEAGGVYTVNTRTAFATKVSQLTIALAGKDFGVDFNPAADRLRIVSDAGQNLRHNVAPGGVTIADGTLAYTPGTAATGVTAVGYTNNDLSATTGTTLVDLDTTRDQGALQVPANDGTLLLTGPLGVPASAVAGFDVRSQLADGVATANKGYATLRPADTGRASLYAVDLLTGKASRIGSFGDADVADIAVTLSR